MGYKVLITTSGIGSRLGEFSKYTNKALLRVGEKPAISHIIEIYPVNTEFVITLGYFGNQVKDYLEIAYPKLSFTFVWVDKFQGEGSSLLYSMFCAKDNLQAPFIFHASDTIISQSLPAPEFNWNAGFGGQGSSNYASFDTLGNKVKVMFDKGNLSPDFLHTGIIGVNNFKLFWNIADVLLSEQQLDQSLSDVDVLKKFLLEDDIQCIELSSWFDIGSVEKIKIAREHFSSDDFHVLDKVKESIFRLDDIIIKFFYDEEICKNRVERTRHLDGIVPKIIDTRPNFYKYKYAEGHLFSKVANSIILSEFLSWADSNMWKPVTGVDEFQSVAFDFYYEKTIKRVTDLQTTRGIEDKVDIINGQTIPSLEDLISKVDFDWLSGCYPTTFHGDFILDNIIYQEDGNFKLIDWRQDFGGEIRGGDKYYDLAKFAHNLVVNHEIVDDNHFKLQLNKNGSILADIMRPQYLVECENQYFNYLDENNLDVKKVKILRSLIWLNMSPLHHHPFDLFLYYYGRYTLFNELKE